MADNVEIQGLEFQIQENSVGAVAGLENLKKALSGLKSVTGSSVKGLDSTSKSIRELKNALSGLNSGDMSRKLTQIASGLRALEQVRGVKISSSIPNQLNALNAALKNVRWTDGDKIRTLVDGLRPLSELGRANMTSFINQLGKLPALIDELEKADVDKFTRQMKELAAAMKPFADEMQKVSNGFSAFPSRIQRLIASTDRYNNSVNRATTGTKAWSNALTGIKLSTVLYASNRIGAALAGYMYQASEWEGIMYRFGRAFGKEAEENYKWINRLNAELQINVQQFMQYASIYGTKRVYGKNRKWVTKLTKIERRSTMETIIKRLSNLLSVKSLVTLVLTGVFAFMACTNQISQDFMTIYAVIIAFYFGTQSQKTQELLDDNKGGK